MWRWKIALVRYDLHGPGRQLSEGTEQESCFNYKVFLPSHVRCEAPGATLPCGAESPLSGGGDDNSDNGSARSTDATRVPSETWEAKSIPPSLPLFAVHSSSRVRACSWKTENVTMEWELMGCRQFPAWRWDHSLKAAGVWDETDSVTLLHALVWGRFPDWKCDLVANSRVLIFGKQPVSEIIFTCCLLPSALIARLLKWSGPVALKAHCHGWLHPVNWSALLCEGSQSCDDAEPDRCCLPYCTVTLW